MTNQRETRIIVAPLDWGMGHATRCIPLIRELQSQGIKVIIGGTEQSRQRIKDSGIIAEELDLPSYSIRYHRSFPAWLMVLMQFGKIRKAIKEEHKILDRYLKENQINAIISDNRYGLFKKEIPSVIITHQINPQSPVKIFQKLINRFVHNLLRKFDEVWIPDFPGQHSASGSLSIPFDDLNFRHIGILSRFPVAKNPEPAGNSVLAIVSGPEPQASIFREQLIRLAIRKKFRITIISSSGSPGNYGLSEEWIRLIYSPGDQEFQRLVNEHRHIIMRSGYSGIMDMLNLGRTAMLVATPGQTEQEYLAQRMINFGFTTIRQKKISEIKFPDAFPSGPLMLGLGENLLLKDAVSALVRMISKQRRNN